MILSFGGFESGARMDTCPGKMHIEHVYTHTQLSSWFQAAPVAGRGPGTPVYETLGFPWWLSGEEVTCQCWRHGFHPWVRKIPHASEQLSPCATTTEPVFWSLGTTTPEPTHAKARAQQQEKPPQWEIQHRNEEWPPLITTREKPLQGQRPSAAKNKYINK